jgi:hypothetical protein
MFLARFPSRWQRINAFSSPGKLSDNVLEKRDWKHFCAKLYRDTHLDWTIAQTHNEKKEKQAMKNDKV